jgi:hypothetical protein
MFASAKDLSAMRKGSRAQGRSRKEATEKVLVQSSSKCRNVVKIRADLSFSSASLYKVSTQPPKMVVIRNL